MTSPAEQLEAAYDHEDEWSDGRESRDAWCRFCGAAVPENVRFCFSCGRAGVVDEHTRVSIGVRRAVSHRMQSSRTTLSFARSRADYSVQRQTRSLLIKTAVALLIAVPYYVGCKTVLGDTFPGNVVAYAQELDQEIASAVVLPAPVSASPVEEAPIIVASN